MASRSISDLSVDLQPIARNFLLTCAAAGIDIIITCTWRSPREQDELYAIGRTKPGRIVTKARAGESKHNALDQSQHPAAKAFDVVPLRHGKPVWGTAGNGIDNDTSDDEKDDLELWQRVGAIGESLGLLWAGRWKGDLREFAHFQIKEAA